MRPASNIAFDRRAALTNLAIAATVAFLVWLAWWMWRDAPASPARQRQITDVTVTWRCGNGHVFEARGAYGSRPCPECGADAYIIRQYYCPEHAEVEAKLRYERGADGKPILAGVCFEEGEWISSPQSLTCPVCGRRLRLVKPNLFSGIETEQGG